MTLLTLCHKQSLPCQPLFFSVSRIVIRLTKCSWSWDQETKTSSFFFFFFNPVQSNNKTTIQILTLILPILSSVHVKFQFANMKTKNYMWKTIQDCYIFSYSQVPKGSESQLKMPANTLSWNHEKYAVTWY